MNQREHEGLAIRRFVFLHQVTEGEGYVSSLRAAIRQARMLTARDVRTGASTLAVGDRIPATDLSGALDYLIVLELLGKTLRPVGSRELKRRQGSKSEQPVARALRHFARPAITSQQRGVMVALRNSFAHNFGLTNRHPPERRHRFILAWAGSGPLITFPQRRWNGAYGDASRGGPTVVNLHALGGVVENVVAEVEQAALARRLRLAAGVTVDELGTAYGFRVGEPHGGMPAI